MEGLEFMTHLYPVADRQGEVHAMPPQEQPAQQKDQFYDDLQQALTAIPSDKMNILLSDFNARVGSRLGNDDPWDLVQGSHGYGECNDAGSELLAFLSSNEAVVCNTLFTKRTIQKQTWQHPKSKQWHCCHHATERSPEMSQRYCNERSRMYY